MKREVAGHVMPALNPAADDDADVDKVSCESFCDLWAVADIDTPDACQSGQTAGAARRLISAHHAV